MEPILSTAQRLDVAEAALSETRDELASATAALATSRAETASATESAAKLSADLLTAKASIESMNTELVAARASLASAQAAAAELREKEQDIEKRASARLAHMQASLGISPPLPTGAPAQAGGAAPRTSNLTGLAKAIAAHQSRATIRK